MPKETEDSCLSRENSNILEIVLCLAVGIVTVCHWQAEQIKPTYNQNNRLIFICDGHSIYRNSIIFYVCTELADD